MGDRYVRSGRRSPIYDYGRVSAPNITSVGQTSFYPGDIHVLPTRYDSAATTQPHYNHHRHNSSSTSTSANWRGPNVSVPVTTTTYTVRKDPITRNTSVREHSRNRSSTLDSISKRPPIIVTTRQAKESSSTSHASASRDVPPSPAPDKDRGRNSYREDYYSLPASSARSRSHTRPYASGSMSSTLDNEEFHRLRQRTNDDRLAPSRTESRRERPTSLYATSTSRHGVASADLGESGYEYTKPSDLVRYDLDNDRRPTYYRPSVTLNDVDRRPYDTRARGPPPTTRGLDKVNRRVTEDTTAGIYDRPAVRMPVPAVVPVPVPDRRSSQLDLPPTPLVERRPSRSGHRPLSLYQESPSRPRADDYVSRDPRERDYHRDEDVGKRGFGLRTDGDKKDSIRTPSRDRRRNSRMEEREREPRRHSDEELDRYDRHDRHERRHSRDYGRKDDIPRPERKNTKDDGARDDDNDKTKLRDKVATGISLAAGAIGLTGALSHKDKEDKEDRGSPRRRGDEESRRDEAEERPKPARRDPEERPRDNDPSEPREKIRKDRDADDAEDKERNRRDAEARLNGDPTAKDDDSSSDESKPRRRQRPASTFKPNDTASLMALKEQLKAKEDSDRENERLVSKDTSPDRRSQRSPSREDEDHRSSRDEPRGRDAAADDKQVRVVSPPRDKDDKKPIKGILKQPKPQFPEEPNPVREGVAPHKDDKTKGNVPPGARWTKINRKLVNPEALTIGKERFEVRDDFVIVLRVLSKEEIEAYTAATAQLRGGLLPFSIFLNFPFVVRRPSPCRPRRDLAFRPIVPAVPSPFALDPTFLASPVTRACALCLCPSHSVSWTHHISLFLGLFSSLCHCRVLHI